MKTIAIVGAGEGLGFSLAQKFGANGFQVALVARNKTKLDAMVERLKNEGIEAFCVSGRCNQKQSVG